MSAFRWVEAALPKKYARESLSMPMSLSILSERKLTASLPIRPAEPVMRVVFMAGRCGSVREQLRAVCVRLILLLVFCACVAVGVFIIISQKYYYLIDLAGYKIIQTGHLHVFHFLQVLWNVRFSLGQKRL